MLTVEGLSAAYGRIPVLRGVSFALAPGERLTVVGANGSGKTTLVMALMGLLPASDGRIRLDDTDITHWPAHRRSRAGIAYVPQGRDLFPALSVRDNLRMGCRADDAVSAAIDRVVALFPVIGGLLDRAGGALSGGEQQIVATARALCAEPRLILLDEPSEGIQPSVVADLARVLTGLQGPEAPAILLVEQNLTFAADVAKKALVMQRGSVASAVPSSALAEPGMLRALLGGEA
jgi:ABC-type branched-subunit amino acid transport system ATPase component